MLRPAMSEILERKQDCYTFVVAVAKRARDLLANVGNPSGFEMPDKQKPLSAAAQEVYSGKVVVAK